ncbi:hypothetical protein MTO96_042586 [Rhipicephalus appendiculatus]
MSMHVTVEGEDINPNECVGSGWTTAISKRKSHSQPGVSDRASSTQRGGSRLPPPPASSRNASRRPLGSPTYRGSTLGSSSAPGVGRTSGGRQTDVCHACGRLGHRADVCPAPENTIGRGCGTASPAEDHECSPKCALFGGASSHCGQDLQATLPSALLRPPQEEAAETRHRNTCDASGVQPMVHLPRS